jgi:hypothetical protein
MYIPSWRFSIVYVSLIEVLFETLAFSLFLSVDLDVFVSNQCKSRPFFYDISTNPASLNKVLTSIHRTFQSVFSSERDLV